MPVSGIPSFGTQIQIGDGLSPQTFKTISHVGDITGPSTTSRVKETTAHSTLIPHSTWVQTIIDDGQLKFPLFYDPSDVTHNLTAPYGLEYLFQNRITRAMRLIKTDPTGEKRQFDGFVEALSETYMVAGVMERQCTIRIVTPPSIV